MLPHLYQISSDVIDAPRRPISIFISEAHKKQMKIYSGGRDRQTSTPRQLRKRPKLRKPRHAPSANARVSAIRQSDPQRTPKLNQSKSTEAGR